MSIRKQINSRTIIHFYIHLYDQTENHRQCDGGKDLPIDGLPRVVILECPTVRPFSQIHWSWTQTRTNKKVKCGPKGGGGTYHYSSIINTLDLSGKRKQNDSATSWSVLPSCFISRRFSMNWREKARAQQWFNPSQLHLYLTIQVYTTLLRQTVSAESKH